MVRTEAGAVTVGDPLSESELFDALSLVLGPDQQAELAVGNVVSFEVDVGVERWNLLAEPAADGIIVRGRAGSSSSKETPTMGPKLDLPKLDTVEPDRESVPSTGKSILRPAKRRTQWDIGVPDAPTSPPEPASAPPAATPSWSRRLAEEEPSDFEIRTPTGEQPASLVDAHELRVDDVELEAMVPASPERVEIEYGGDPTGLDPSVGSDPTPDPTAAEVRPALADFATVIPAGTLCLVPGDGNAEMLATSLQGGDYALIDDVSPGGILAAAADLEPGGRFAVRLEDPSEALGWILRRLEEGARGVVETRARPAPGARRVLLGVAASTRAEQWLAVHPTVWFEEQPGGWSCLDF